MQHVERQRLHLWVGDKQEAMSRIRVEVKPKLGIRV